MQAQWWDPRSGGWGDAGVSTGFGGRLFLNPQGQWVTFDKLQKNANGQVLVQGQNHNGYGNQWMPMTQETTYVQTTQSGGGDAGTGSTRVITQDEYNAAVQKYGSVANAATAGFLPSGGGQEKILDPFDVIKKRDNQGQWADYAVMAAVGGVFGAAATGALGATASVGAPAAGDAAALGASGSTAAGTAGTAGTYAASEAYGANPSAPSGPSTTSTTTGSSSLLSQLNSALGTNATWGDVASLATLAYGLSETGNAPKVDLTAVNQNAQQTADMAKRQETWASTNYDDTLKPQADRLAANNATNQTAINATADAAAAAGARAQARYDESYDPVNKQLAEEALRFNSGAYARDLSTNAQAQVQSEFSKADRELMDTLAENGNQVSGNMAASMLQRSAMQRAASTSGAALNATLAADKEGFDRLSTAATQGNNIAQIANTNRTTTGALRTQSSAIGAQTMQAYNDASRVRNDGISTAIAGQRSAGDMLATAANMDYASRRDAYQDRMSMIGLFGSTLANTAGRKKSTTYGAVA